MKVNLVFTTELKGHYIEYVHHIFMAALEHIDENYIFIVPPAFEILKENYAWPGNVNIEIVKLNEIEIARINSSNKYIRSLKRYLILKKYINLYHPDGIFLISLMEYMPFLGLMIYKKLRIRGIIYLIYLYRWKESTFVHRLFDILKYLILTRLKIFENIFILNDRSSVLYLNKLFKTKKFCYIPDPVIDSGNDNNVNLREQLSIEIDKKVILHPGGISERKGSLDILKAIDYIDPSTRKIFCFIFAGLIDKDVRDEIYSLKRKNEKCVQILIFESFIPYDYLMDLFYTADFVILPYKNKFQSSGMLGYANFFSKVAIVPKGGLLGKLVKKYRMGILISEVTGKGIAEVLNKLDIKEIAISQKYLKQRSPAKFIEIILS